MDQATLAKLAEALKDSPEVYQATVNAMQAAEVSNHWYLQTALLLIIAFGIILVLQLAMAWRKGWDPMLITLIGITVLSAAGVFAALTVDNERNGPAIFGLLGTLGGYLIGRFDKRGSGEPTTSNTLQDNRLNPPSPK